MGLNFHSLIVSKFSQPFLPALFYLPSFISRKLSRWKNKTCWHSKLAAAAAAVGSSTKFLIPNLKDRREAHDQEKLAWFNGEEPSPLGGCTGLGWKAICFYFWSVIFSPNKTRHLSSGTSTVSKQLMVTGSLMFKKNIFLINLKICSYMPSVPIRVRRLWDCGAALHDCLRGLL